jgi:hypothetical protein
MRKMIEWVQAMLTAASLAEDGEVEAARRMMADADGEDEVPRPRRIQPIRSARPARGAVAKGSGA